MRIKPYHAHYRLALSEAEAWELVQQVIDGREFDKDRRVTLIRRGIHFVLEYDRKVEDAKLPEVLGRARRQGEHVLVDVRVTDLRWTKFVKTVLLVVALPLLCWGLINGEWSKSLLLLGFGLRAYAQMVESGAENTAVAAIERRWMKAMHDALSVREEPSMDIDSRRTRADQDQAA